MILFVVDLDDFKEEISQIIFVLYFLGYKEIKIVSKNVIGRNVRVKIKDTVEVMAGSEIVFEDDCCFEIKVLLDKAMIDIHQFVFTGCLF